MVLLLARELATSGLLMTQAPQTNLTAELDRFIGRERELEMVVDWLKKFRLISLVGPPGCGKSRLARQIGLHLVGPDRPFATEAVYFIDLTHAYDPSAVISQMASRLGVEVPAQDDDRDFSDRGRELVEMHDNLLLIMDNVEHLIAECAPAFARWVRDHESLRILCTSLEPLAVRGERVLELQPLQGADAVELFLERGFFERGLSTSDRQRQVIESIVDRLDGLPLAIELAAARTGMYPVEAIRDALEENLEFLTTTMRDAPARHRSVEALLDWIWEQLNEEEKTTLARCSAFSGGFDVEAAAKLLHPLKPQILETLHNRSLLVRDASDASRSRLTMLFVIRRFAAHKLESRDDRIETMQRHAQIFGARASAWVEAILSHQMGEFVARMEREKDNFLAVIRRDWLGRFDKEDEPGWLTCALQSACALAQAHIYRGNLPEITSHLDRLLSLCDHQDGIPWEPRIRAMVYLAKIRNRDMADGALDLILKATELAREHGLLATESFAHHTHAEIVMPQSKEHGIELLAMAIDCAVEAGDARRELHSRQAMDVAHSYMAGSRPPQEYEATLKLADKVGDRWIAALCHTNLGLAWRERGNNMRALLHLEDAARLFLELNDRMTRARVLVFIATVHYNLGQLESGRQALREVEEIYSDVEKARFQPLPLIGFAHGDLIEENYEAANEKLTRAIQLSRRHGLADIEGVSGLVRYHVIARQHRSEARMRAAIREFPPVANIQAFNVATRVRAVQLMAASLEDGDLSPLIELENELLERNLPVLTSFVKIQRAVHFMIQAWRHTHDRKSHHVALAEVLKSIDAMRLHEDATPLDASFEIRNWYELLSEELPASSQLTLQTREHGPETLLYTPDFHRIRPPHHDWIDFSRRHRSRSLLEHLITNRLENPGVAITADQLIEATWPGENIKYDSAMARLYTAISELRKLGFEDVLLKTEDGYLVDPQTDTRMAGS